MAQTGLEPMTAVDEVPVPQLTKAERQRLGKRARLLAGASVSYNTVESIVAISAGTVAGSGALISFGLDSIIEVSSGLVILWQFRHKIPESRERIALRLIAISFFALATYIAIDSTLSLLNGDRAEASPVGIVLASLSIAIMPALSIAQRRTGRSLGSGSVIADGSQTMLCSYLSVVLLLGLVLNATLGWWWADSLVALVIAGVAIREGLDAWQGKHCCPVTPESSTCEDACC